MFALGFRNVFSMDCDPATGWPIVADNGPAGHDQVRLVEPGSNHEWPLSNERDEDTPPLYTSGNVALAPTGVVVRSLEDGASEVLFASFHLESVYALRIEPDGTPADVVVVRHEVAGAPLSLAADFQGCVYMGTTDGIWLLRETLCERQIAVEVKVDGAERFDGDPAEVYRANCSPCHGLQREGGEAPSLLSDRLGDPDAFYIDTIVEGRANKGMPAWGAAGMSQEQARAMLAYLRSQTD